MLKGFAFSGYRSFGDDLAIIAPLKKINFIIGQNNSGKSNIIYFIKHHLSPVTKRISNPNETLSFTELDRHNSGPARVRIAFPISYTDEEIEKYLAAKIPDNIRNFIQLRPLLKTLISHDSFLKSHGYIWFEYETDTLNGGYSFLASASDLKPLLQSSQWQELWVALTQYVSGGEINSWVSSVIESLPPPLPATPPVEFIPAIRKIGAPESTPNDFSGEGIITRLATLQNPSLADQEEKEKFNNIQLFLREVLENPSATIEVPFGRDMILVHMDGKTLPLESLGTGIHEVIILAAAATQLDETVLCIEEPELHIHPLLQQKLIRYLSNKTSNQYIFSTHSAHLLETEGAEVFHVRYNNGKSTVESITTTQDRSDICKDLGYKASDLLQTNCIIWVEGPSDRIYINTWLKAENNELTEGIHYSIMFFGGRSFSHLTANDDTDELNDFISVRKLNRHTCIVFDSDKTREADSLNATKRRLRMEFNQDVGFAWVTKGREIENYINSETIESCIKAVHPSASHTTQKGQWANQLKYISNSRKGVVANKVKVARYYAANHSVNFDQLDLKRQIKKLVKFICESNNIEPKA